MICVTRLNGEQFALNPDLIQRVEGHPDTVITLVDATKYVVTQSVADVIREIRDFRSSILHTAHRMDAGSYAAPRLDGVTTDMDEDGGSSVVPFPTREER